MRVPIHYIKLYNHYEAPPPAAAAAASRSRKPWPKRKRCVYTVRIPRSNRAFYYSCAPSCIKSVAQPPCGALRCSSVAHVLDGALLVDVDVEAVGLEVHGAHAVGLDDAVLGGEVLLGEGLGSW